MRPPQTLSRSLLLVLALAGTACAPRAQDRATAASASAVVPAAVRAAVDAPDRSADDRALDAGRQPARMLAFFGIRPGARVAELGAGGGYTTEPLAPGGVYGIVDHSAKPGSGLADVESLHRIEERVVRSEVEAAGFELAAEADFLRNPMDERDWSPSPRAAGARRGTSDRFVLEFLK